MRRHALTLLACLSTGCSGPTPPPASSAFDRPEDVAFFCYDLTDDVVTALEACTPAIAATIEDDTGNPANERYALHALVTQTTTGEVAAVRLTGAAGEPGVIDTDVRIPGFTFAAVGAVPSALAVSRANPEHIFVLSRGSGEIHVIETAQMRKGRGVQARANPLELGDRSLPSAMLLAPDERALFVSLPETGQIGRIPVNAAGELGIMELLDLSATLPDPVDLSLLPADQRPPSYLYTCNTPPLFVAPLVPPRAPLSLGVTPEPVAIIIDPETRELLVADRALPMIHVIDPVTFIETSAIATSVPVNQLALTPRVPARFGDPTATERYLYAIDESDGSILVVDYTDPTRGSFGGVLSVEISAPTDRLETPFPARALAVVSPAYDADAVAYCVNGDDGEHASGLSLHGVFLAVGTIDGRIRFFDVFDQDTTCRGFGCADAATNPSPDDEIVSIGRHRPRLGSFRDVGVSLDPAPTWETDAIGIESVDESGDTDAPTLVPALRAVSCEEPLDVVYPLEPGAFSLVCAVRDPWAAVSQTFRATFEGRIPATGTTGANLEDDGATILAQTDFCRAGVIGSEDVPATGYLAGYPGDVVAITGDLPPSILLDEGRVGRCEQLTQRSLGGEITPVLLPILSAESHPEGVHASYVGRLRVGEPLGLADFGLVDVFDCYPELFQIEVRTRDSFIVEVGLTGFTHPIVERDVDQRCVVDQDLADAFQRGRAFFGETFRSPELTFALGERPADIDGRHPVLEMRVADVPAPLTVDVSTIGGSSSPSLLTRLVYNDVDERLYAVDQAVTGLLRLRLSRLTVQQTFR